MKKENIIEIAYTKAIKVLDLCSTPNGFFAAYPGYDMVFGRDSMIISLGASLVRNKKLQNTFKQSLITLGKNQSLKGQIPNAVDKYVKRRHHVDFKSIDSTLWFIIGHYIYKERYKDSLFFNKSKPKVQKALTWLSYQDMGEDGMLEQLPTTDWQDAFPHRYGHTINTQALWFRVLELTGKGKQAKELKKKVNEDKEDGLWNGNFYLPWRWKNHNKYQEKGEWFDTLGNVLAIIFGLADKSKAEKILSYIKNKKINYPYPVKAIYPPIKKGSKDWQDYFLDAESGKAWHYLNAGIWTYVGGFYVCALIKMKKFKEAEYQLKKLAEANMKNDGNFAEWLHGLTGKIIGTGKKNYQGWNAGMYIVAYESLKRKRCLV